MHIPKLYGLVCFLIFYSMVHAEAIQVSDDRGRQVTLPYPAQRIISLGPSMTEMLFAIGAGTQLIAVDQASDYPVAVNKINKIGGGLALDLESIAAQQADLIIVWDSGYHRVALEKISPHVTLYYAEPLTLADIAITLRKFGLLTGRSNDAEKMASGFEQRLGKIRQQYHGRSSLRGFYQLWQTPLLSIGGTHVISDAMMLCGVSNIFDDSKVMVPRVEIETVLQRSPQMIITTTNQDKKVVSNFWQHWFGNSIPPIVDVNESLMSRHSPRILEAVEQVCSKADELRQSGHAH